MGLAYLPSIALLVDPEGLWHAEVLWADETTNLTGHWHAGPHEDVVTILDALIQTLADQSATWLTLDHKPARPQIFAVNAGSALERARQWASHHDWRFTVQDADTLNLVLGE